MRDIILNVLFGLLIMGLYGVLLITFNWFLPFDQANHWTAGLLFGALAIVSLLKIILWIKTRNRKRKEK